MSLDISFGDNADRIAVLDGFLATLEAIEEPSAAELEQIRRLNLARNKLLHGDGIKGHEIARLQAWLIDAGVGVE